MMLFLPMEQSYWISDLAKNDHNGRILATSLLHNHSEIHIIMNRTVEVKGSCSVEWSDRLLIISIELDLDGGRTCLNAGPLGAVAIPPSILNDMNDWNVINERQFVTLLNGDNIWYKLAVIHMDRGCRIAVTTSGSSGRVAGCEEENAQYDAWKQNLFHHTLFLKTPPGTPFAFFPIIVPRQGRPNTDHYGIQYTAL
jgi:hypothetical protein